MRRTARGAGALKRATSPPHKPRDRAVRMRARFRSSHSQTTRKFRTSAFTGALVQKSTGSDTLTEMVSVLNASRAYEANAAVFEIGKQLAQRTIDIGPRMSVEPLIPDIAPQPVPATARATPLRDCSTIWFPCSEMPSAQRTVLRRARATCKAPSTSARRQTSRFRLPQPRRSAARRHCNPS